MSSLSQAKTLGGVGALLVLLSFIPSIGALLGIAGFVLVLVAIKYVSDALRNKKIFDNALIAVILSIIGIIVGSLVIVATVLAAFQNGYFASGYPFTPSLAITAAQWITFGAEIGLGLLGAWAFLLASSVFLRRSYSAMGDGLNVNMFSTAGLLYLIGAATAIVGIGFLILLIAQIITAVAFLSIQVPAEVSQTKPVTVTSTPAT